MKNKIGLFFLSIAWIGLFAFQSLAGHMDLAKETMIEALQKDPEKTRVILGNLEQLARETDGKMSTRVRDFEWGVAQLNQLLKGSVIVEAPATSESIISPQGVLVRLNVRPVGGKEASSPAMFVISNSGLKDVIVGEENISIYIGQTRSQGPGIAGSAFGEHDQESMDYVRSLLPQAKPLAESVTPDQLQSVQGELEKLPATLTLPVDRLPVAARSIPALSNISQILAQTLVVDDPQDRFLVAFVDDKPVFERRYLEALLRNGDFALIARHLFHEDLEPRIARVLTGNGIIDIHPHDVVTAIETSMVGPSVVGRANALYDDALVYRAELGILSGRDAVDARAVQAYRSLSTEDQAAITEVARRVSAEPLGVALDVSPDSVRLGGIALSENLANALRNAGLSARNFIQEEDLTYPSVVQFLTRSVLLNRVYEASKSEERVLAGHQVRNVTDADKAAIIDMETLLADVKINEDSRTVDVSQAAIGVSKALSEKIAQIQAQGGNLKIFLVSRTIPQNVLDHLIRQLDATVAEGLPVAVSYKDVSELMARVSEKFEGRTLTADDVLFYVTKENVAEYRADPNFAQFYKVIQVEKAETGERVSVAKLLVGVQWLYLPQEQARNIDQVVALFRDVLTELYQAGEISAEEYQELLPTKDSDTGFLIIPPMKSNSMADDIENSLRTTIAAAKFA